LWSTTPSVPFTFEATRVVRFRVACGVCPRGRAPCRAEHHELLRRIHRSHSRPLEVRGRGDADFPCGAGEHLRQGHLRHAGIVPERVLSPLWAAAVNAVTAAQIQPAKMQRSATSPLPWQFEKSAIGRDAVDKRGGFRGLVTHFAVGTRSSTVLHYASSERRHLVFPVMICAP